ncbi:hypothetical protein LINGRAHAP2_LOCUS25359 [Linum grandiflorum]
MMLDIVLVFEKRVSFWIVIAKLSLPIFIEKATQLRVSSLTTGILLVLDFIFSLLFLVML